MEYISELGLFDQFAALAYTNILTLSEDLAEIVAASAALSTTNGRTEDYLRMRDMIETYFNGNYTVSGINTAFRAIFNTYSLGGSIYYIQASNAYANALANDFDDLLALLIANDSDEIALHNYISTLDVSTAIAKAEALLLVLDYIANTANNVTLSLDSKELYDDIVIAVNVLGTTKDSLDLSIWNNYFADYIDLYPQVAEKLTLKANLGQGYSAEQILEMLSFVEKSQYLKEYLLLEEAASIAELMSVTNSGLIAERAFTMIYDEAMARKNNRARLSLGIGIIGEDSSLLVDIKSNYINESGETVSSIKDVLTDEEKAEYTEYSDLTLRINVNASFSFSYNQGDLNITDILDLISLPIDLDLDISFL